MDGVTDPTAKKKKSEQRGSYLMTNRFGQHYHRTTGPHHSSMGMARGVGTRRGGVGWGGFGGVYRKRMKAHRPSEELADLAEALFACVR